MAIQFPTLSGPAASPPFPTLAQIQRQQSRLFGQLASGNQLTSAAVDPAGLAVAEQLTSQINGSEQAQNNIGDALSLLNTAEGGLGSQQDILQKQRTLIVQAGDAALSPGDVDTIQTQIQRLGQGLDQIGQQTQFNGIALLDSSAGTLHIQSGANAGQQTPINLSASDSQALGTSSVDVTTSAGQQAGLGQLDQAINSSGDSRGTVGATENSLLAAQHDEAVNEQNQTASRSQLADTNIAQASSQLSSSLLREYFSLFALQQQAHTFALASTLLAA